MKLSRTFWITLGIGLFAVATVVLYMVYQGQAEKKQEAEDTIAEAEAVISLRLLEKGDLEEGLAQQEAELATLEAELAQWQITIGELADEMSLLETELGQMEDERAQAILRAIALLDETAAKFISSIESIEYDETLFGFAHNSNLMIVSLTVADPSPEVEEDITYYNTKFTVTVRGEVADILGFINTVVTDNDFKTSILEPIAITVPEPLTDEEKEQIREEVAEEEIERLIKEAIDILPVQERLTPEDIEKIVMQLGALIEELEGLTAEEIAELTVSEIEALIKQAIEGLEEKITEEDIVELIGKLGEIIEELEGLTAEEIAERVAKKIEELETPSATITLNIYTYEGEGE